MNILRLFASFFILSFLFNQLNKEVILCKSAQDSQNKINGTFNTTVDVYIYKTIEMQIEYNNKTYVTKNYEPIMNKTINVSYPIFSDDDINIVPFFFENLDLN